MYSVSRQAINELGANFLLNDDASVQYRLGEELVLCNDN
jgi:hypothetical protein